MSNHPRVLSVVWNLIRGGTEGQCARVAMGLSRRGWSHRVAVFRREGFFLDAVTRACGSVYHLDIRHFLRPETLRQIRLLSRWLQSEKVDVVHAWDADAAIFGSLAAARSRIPLITSRRDLGEIYPRHKLWLMRRADCWAVSVVTNTGVIRDHLLAHGMPAGRIRLISNLLDLAEFDRLAAQPFPKKTMLPAGRLVGLVARLDAEKDVATFLRAASQLAGSRTDLGFIVAGAGPERQNLLTLAAQLGINSRIAFLGEVHEVPSLMRLFEIGVLTPSANEGLSNTVLEYMAASRPFVVTDCGGNRELAGSAGERGWVVPVGDADALAAAIESLLQDSVRAADMGRRGRAFVETHCGEDVVCDQFAALYHEAVADGRRTTNAHE